MNEAINRFLLVGDKLMPEMHSRKNIQRIKSKKKQEIPDILPKWTRWSLFLRRYGLWRFWIFQ